MKRRTKQTGQTAIVAYVRVSTDKQKQSGLGLEAQRASVESYAAARGLPIIAWHEEAESGRHDDRPRLAEALAHAKRTNSLLVIAKLDRLARKVSFISKLMDSEVEFVACDNPHANKITIHILAAVAESEADAISARTSAALQAAKRRGVLLGSARPGHWDGKEHMRLNGLAKARQSALATNAANYADAYVDVLPMMREMRASGETLQAIADRINSQGRKTRRGSRWTPWQVSVVLGSELIVA